MKVKKIVYFLLIVTGALFVGLAGDGANKEYFMSIGYVLLMFGIYKTTQVYAIGKQKEREDTNHENRG